MFLKPEGENNFNQSFKVVSNIEIIGFFHYVTNYIIIEFHATEDSIDKKDYQSKLSGCF